MKISPPPPPPTTATVFLLCLLLIAQPTHVCSQPRGFIEKGSSLSVEREHDILVSPDGTFSAGFYKVGTNACCFSIWFSNSAARTVVWTANRDRPVNGRRSRVWFSQSGALVLVDADDSEIWMSDSGSTTAVKAELLSTGNLVTKDLDGQVVWQSFSSPTDTLLPSQPLLWGRRLVSAKSRGELASGYYNMIFDDDNSLRLLYSGPDISSLYWPDPDFTIYENGRQNFNSSRIAVLDEYGRFSSTDGFKANASEMGLKLKRRLTMDHDGNLRMYSMNESDGMWAITWVALSYQCKVHGLCGRNGICIYTPEPRCTCPPGYEVVDPSNWNQGCRPTFSTSWCSNSQNNTQFRRLLQTDFYGFDFGFYTGVTLEFCKNTCLTNCPCKGFLYRFYHEKHKVNESGYCYAKSTLFSGYTIPGFGGDLYLKLPVDVRNSESSSFEVPPPHVCKAVGQNMSVTVSYQTRSKNHIWSYFYAFAAAICAVEALLIASGCWYLRRGDATPKNSIDEGYLLIRSQFRRFTYRELSTVTRAFKKELGRGSSGVVYEGLLEDTGLVSVKKLEDVVQEDEEFWAETSFLGRINHMNVVRMRGFCSEGPHRLLVYEYMENGSLDKHLFERTGAEKPIGWNERFRTALGTARGLAYLHHECLEWVIHCDVKPENILLDGSFEAKIGDFGLAKLFQSGGSAFGASRMRGTMGYMAPEWGRGLPITAKVDVYSYGVVLLEILTGIRASELGEDADIWGLVGEMRNRLVDDGDDALIEDLLDCRLNGEVNRKEAAVMQGIAVSCLEDYPRRRPTMNAIVEKLLACQETNSHSQPAMTF